ncbi:MAG: patatin-like phospholipase family protein [Acidimicrobiaceae bacterium]|nr:patatin-like phospholipase family protein [Acidimicrobiaceae bacterium]
MNSSQDNLHTGDLNADHDVSRSAEHTIEVALVLGAGGPLAEAWHAGVVRALHEATGWDARRAELILGTSAGAMTGLQLRMDIPPRDLCARYTDAPHSGEGRRPTFASPPTSTSKPKSWVEWIPQSLEFAARTLWPPWRVRPLHVAAGLLPRCVRATSVPDNRLAGAYSEQWPRKRFWVPVVRLEDGKRVVFGRDDVDVSVAQAVKAGCSVPVGHEPAIIDSHRYVGGALHSDTNADLAGPPAFDAVIVSSAMSGETDWNGIKSGLQKTFTKLRDDTREQLKRVYGGIRKTFHDDLSTPINDPTSVSPVAGRQADVSAGSSVSSSGSSVTAKHVDLSADVSAGGNIWRNKVLRHVQNYGQSIKSAKAIKTVRRQRASIKLSEEIEKLHRKGISVLVVEPDADTVKLMDDWLDAWHNVSLLPGKDSFQTKTPVQPQTPEDRKSENKTSAAMTSERQEILSQVASIAHATTQRQLSSQHGKRFARLLVQASDVSKSHKLDN